MGRYRDEILLYAGIGGTDPAKIADAAEEHVGLGYQALKLHLLLDMEGVAEICRAVRQRVGPGIMLMVDTHMRQTVASSIRAGARTREAEVLLGWRRRSYRTIFRVRLRSPGRWIWRWR